MFTACAWTGTIVKKTKKTNKNKQIIKVDKRPGLVHVWNQEAWLGARYCAWWSWRVVDPVLSQGPSKQSQWQALGIRGENYRDGKECIRKENNSIELLAASPQTVDRITDYLHVRFPRGTQRWCFFGVLLGRSKKVRLGQCYTNGIKLCVAVSVGNKGWIEKKSEYFFEKCKIRAHKSAAAILCIIILPHFVCLDDGDSV